MTIGTTAPGIGSYPSNAQVSAARRQTVEELAISSGGALETEPVVRVFLSGRMNEPGMKAGTKGEPRS